MPVRLHAAADDLAFEHVERGKQRGAVALIVMSYGAAGLLGAVQPGSAISHRR